MQTRKITKTLYILETGKITTIRRPAVRETGVSRRALKLKTSPETLRNITDHYGIRGF